ncbi:immunoglobulin superfamily DCC subclass member 3-like isoform X7 [Symphalangus syndactylus]|uniref:immunoglobulin superfamily DCC subclass member 3-like isoform X7 n=1 Tax=Symphalangus syndactylus TaxID=9590 RepID=UPI003005AB88
MSSRGVTTRLSLEPGNTVAVQEHPLVLPCQVEGEPPVSISWQQDRLALANDSGATLMPDGSLHLAALPSHWSLPSCAHEYHCMAQNSYGRLVSRRARVQLASLSRFHQHPESAEVEQGGVARFQCLIQGVPEPSISWEHNGTALNIASHRVTLLPSSILHIASVSQADMGTYRCMAWNVASTRHSQDAQLTLSVGPPRLLQEPEILSGPQNLTLTVHQTAMLECIATGHPQPLVSWSCLDGRSISVEGIQVLGTGNLMISDVSVQHSDVYVCAANQPGSRVRRTAQGVLLMQAPAALGFSTKVLNATSVQASWELPPQLGPIQGFKLFHRKLPAAHFEGPLLLASSVSSFLYTDLEPAALYEIKLQAFNGNGDGNSSARFVSLRDVPLATPDGTVSTESKTGCSCSQGESSSLPGVVVGIHVGLAALIVCLLCLFLGWRHSLLCKQESQECWAVPPTASDRAGGRQGQTQSGGKLGEKTELTTQMTVEQLALA